MSARDKSSVFYDETMKPFDLFDDTHIPDQVLDDYLRLCQEIYLTMKEAGTWPWPDLQNSENLLESEDN